MRPLHVIAREIKRVWPKPYFGAAPYIDAMLSMDSIHEYYFFASGDSIVRYFLANARTWRGDDARRIKAELRGML